MAEESSDAAVTDDALSQAAAEAKEEIQEEEQEETQDGLQAETEVTVEKEEELDEEGLPVDHAKRSDFGRKVSAMHRRQDEFEERIEKLLGLLERSSTPNEPINEIDPDEPLTYAELNSVLDKREQTLKQQRDNYDKKYTSTVGKLSAEIDDNEYEAIIAEMQNITYVPSSNPSLDAEINYSKAERAYLRKQLAGTVERPNPLKGNSPRAALGSATNQKSVTKQVALPKLDAAGASYLAYVTREDGSEKATKLHQSLGKGE